MTTTTKVSIPPSCETLATLISHFLIQEVAYYFERQKISMMRLIWRAFILLGLLWAAACSAKPTSTPIVEPYPPPVRTTNQPYPTTTDLPYPVATIPPTPIPGAVPFLLGLPLVEGATEIHGTGLAGVPLILESVTFMGSVLCQTTVNSDGTFMCQVAPLQANDMIGIALGVLDGTRWKPEEFNAPDYHGPGVMAVPNAGYFLDTAIVQPR